MKRDQVFTPCYIVKQMLDDIGYNGENLTKRIFEPSFGDGAFLMEMVDRIIKYGDIKLLDNIYGCEIDPVLYDRTVDKLNGMLAEHGITYDWHNLLCCDAMDYPRIPCDFVVGNPPYIRIHDLDIATRLRIEREYRFGQGMTDLYIIFFELGLQRLQPGGQLIYITPNSWLKNSSQRQFRQYLAQEHLVHKITDYGTVPVFGDVLTYTAITQLTAGSNQCQYTMMKSATVPEFSTMVDVQAYGNKPWVFVSAADEQFLTSLTGPALGELCTIQNGVSTNADRIYIVPNTMTGPYIRPVIKASTLDQSHNIIFPYEWTGTGYQAVPEEKLRAVNPEVYAHLCTNKEKLLARDMERNTMWYQYARNQSIQTVRHPKFVLKHIIRDDQTTCEFAEVPADTVVYSGMQLIVNRAEDIAHVRDILSSPEFCRYLRLAGKDMAGGYKSINTKLVKEFRTSEQREHTHEKGKQ